MVAHVTNPSAALLDELPSWVTLVRAANPGPMTLDGTNSWVLRPPGSEQCIVIDPGPPMEDHLVELSRKGDVQVILATHGHSDHVGGLPRFRELAPAGAVAPGRSVEVMIPGGLRVETLAT